MEVPSGALVVALMGYAYLKTGRYSFLGDGVREFLRKNPRLLGRKAESNEGVAAARVGRGPPLNASIPMEARPKYGASH